MWRPENRSRRCSLEVRKPFENPTKLCREDACLRDFNEHADTLGTDGRRPRARSWPRQLRRVPAPSGRPRAWGRQPATIADRACARKKAMPNQPCNHILNLRERKTPARLACEACEKIGSTWVHLRTCQTCGTTLCCDSSPNQHASKHAGTTGHPVVISAEPNETWLWCYVDQIMIAYSNR